MISLKKCKIHLPSRCDLSVIHTLLSHSSFFVVPLHVLAIYAFDLWLQKYVQNKHAINTILHPRKKI